MTQLRERLIGRKHKRVNREKKNKILEFYFVKSKSTDDIDMKAALGLCEMDKQRGFKAKCKQDIIITKYGGLY